MRLLKILFTIFLFLIISISIFSIEKGDPPNPCNPADYCHARYYDDCCGPYNPEQHPECTPYCW